MPLTHGQPGWGEACGRSEQLMTQGYYERQWPPIPRWPCAPFECLVGNPCREETNTPQVYDMLKATQGVITRREDVPGECVTEIRWVGDGTPVISFLRMISDL